MNAEDKIWIDLDNSPHVPFFLPIIRELERRGYRLLLTSRDNAQVLELLRRNNLDCMRYGRHYGKDKFVKLLGLGLRALQLAPLVVRERPSLALSHGSRSQIALASVLNIPSLAITDYEHARMQMPGIRPRWLMVPEVVAENVTGFADGSLLSYPGIKEDVYVPRFRPSPGIREELGLEAEDIVVTLRPPATDAHYQNPMSDELLGVVIEFLSRHEDVRVVMLPRNKSQETGLRRAWPALFATRRIRIPERLVDGLNLIWFSDLVISGGGTMNREAAALGVPVYSVFRGKLGAVDRYLAAAGRLVLIESARDLNRIRLVRRVPPPSPAFGEKPALTAIVEKIVGALNSSRRYPVEFSNRLRDEIQ